jgi:PAS domain S-box-containing protein
MYDQPLAQRIADIQRQMVGLHQHATATLPQHSLIISQLCVQINGALEELCRIESAAADSATLVQLPPDHECRLLADAVPAAPAADRSHADGSEPLSAFYQGCPQSPSAATLLQAEPALLDQHTIIKTITDNTTACLFMMDAQNRCTFMNPAAERVTGYTLAEVKGEVLHNLIHHSHPDSTPFPMAECPIGRALAQNKVVRAHEDVFVRKDGTFFPVICAASPIIKDGVPVGTVIEVRDVSDSKQTEADRNLLLEAEQRAVRKAQLQAEQLRGLTAASIAITGALSVHDVLHLITEQARVVIGAHQAVSSLIENGDWSQAISAVSMSHKYAAWHEYHVPLDGSGVYAEVCRTNVPMRLTQAELEAHTDMRGFGTHANEHPAMRGWLAAPLIGRDGRNMGVLQLSDKFEGDFTTEDESILVQLAQMASGALENARLYTAAQDAIKARNEFLSVASHELNTPITSMRGYAQLLIRQLEKGQAIDAERMARALRAIDQQSTKLSQLISQLLDISRIESGRLILNCQPCDLRQLVHDVATNLQTTTQQHTLVVCASESLIASVDPLRLEQVMTNLIGNAIKYSPGGGSILINLAQPGSNDVEISVTDNGIGIPPEHRAHIFDRFYQAHGAGHFGGMGLGLSISQQIVALHGGELHAEFPPEGGTRFVIRLSVV